jgi:DNA-binding response OmpR family regulator
MITLQSLSAWKSLFSELKLFEKNTHKIRICIRACFYIWENLPLIRVSKHCQTVIRHVKLTTKESDLLKLLCQNANKILERNYALKSIWIDDNYFNARSMDVYITKLRKHLKDEPTVEIINVHGKGYKLIV